MHWVRWSWDGGEAHTTGECEDTGTTCLETVALGEMDVAESNIVNDNNDDIAREKK
jgi:hypothetical protein